MATARVAAALLGLLLPLPTSSAAASAGVASAERQCSARGADGSCLAGERARAKDASLIQRAVRRTELTVNASRPNPEDYDCNGDGVAECGEWDYTMGMCKNQRYCGHFYRFPDGTLDVSCRCRHCSNPDWEGTAFADPALSNPEEHAPFNAMGWGRFKNWADHLDTCSNWLMPRTDEALRGALSFARERGYKVRISGAGHSAGGIVTDGKDPSVFVISLAEYVAPGQWEFGLRTMPDGSKRATVNAGWTQFHLYERVRPLGFFMPAQTAGYFFSLGGIVANSVHGGSYLAGFVHSYTTRMRVMSWDGTIRLVESEWEMRYWRCSFGLLGVILGVEIQLEYRSHLQMYTTERKVDWNSEEFWKFIKQDAEANLPSELVPADGGTGSRKAWNGEFFIDFVNGGDMPAISVYAQKANSSVDADFGGELGIPRGVVRNYAKLKNKKVHDDWHGRMSWGEAARRDGAPPIKIAGVDVNDALKAFRKLGLAKMMSSQALSNIPRLARTLAKKVNDGFFLTQSPAALAAAYFVKPEHAFESMDFLRRVQLESLGHKDFVWNLPGEFRFLNVSDTAVLQPVPAGLWFNSQMISFADLAENDQAWKRDFMKVERDWVERLGAKPHMGKLFGFSEGSNGEVEPFADSFSCTIYTDAQKAAFSEYRQQLDPEGLFATGLGMKFLAPCSK